MAIVEIIKIVGVAIPPLAALISFAFALYKAIKAKRHAKTDADKAKAENDMLYAINGFIAAAEEAYLAFDPFLKQSGKTSGAVKKETVMTKLQAYALAKGYEFNAEFWSDRVDDIVNLTKKVNSK